MVEILIDDHIKVRFNDPSDAWDWLISKEGIPKGIALKNEEKNTGWDWGDLPMRFGYVGKMYEMYKKKEISPSDRVMDRLKEK